MNKQTEQRIQWQEHVIASIVKECIHANCPLSIKQIEALRFIVQNDEQITRRIYRVEV